MSVRSRIKCSWVRLPLQSFKWYISHGLIFDAKPKRSDNLSTLLVELKTTFTQFLMHNVKSTQISYIKFDMLFLCYWWHNDIIWRHTVDMHVSVLYWHVCCETSKNLKRFGATIRLSIVFENLRRLLILMLSNSRRQCESQQLPWSFHPIRHNSKHFLLPGAASRNSISNCILKFIIASMFFWSFRIYFFMYCNEKVKFKIKI